MPKSSQKQIRDDEKKVIRELQKNAKESIGTIAKRCKFSRQKVWRIVGKLEKNHTIWGYTAIIDEEKQSLTNYIVLIKKTTVPINENLADTIIRRKLEDLASETGVDVESSFYVHGTYDWIIFFTAEGIKQAKKFCEHLNILYTEYINELHLLEIMFPVKKQGILNPKAMELKRFL